MRKTGLVNYAGDSQVIMSNVFKISDGKFCKKMLTMESAKDIIVMYGSISLCFLFHTFPLKKSRIPLIVHKTTITYHECHEM